jgi:hypothetical protein
MVRVPSPAVTAKVPNVSIGAENPKVTKHLPARSSIIGSAEVGLKTSTIEIGPQWFEVQKVPVLLALSRLVIAVLAVIIAGTLNEKLDVNVNVEKGATSVVVKVYNTSDAEAACGTARTARTKRTKNATAERSGPKFDMAESLQLMCGWKACCCGASASA